MRTRRGCVCLLTRRNPRHTCPGKTSERTYSIAHIVTASWSEVYDMVGLSDNLHIMLYHDNGMPGLYEFLDHQHQLDGAGAGGAAGYSTAPGRTVPASGWIPACSYAPQPARQVQARTAGRAMRFIVGPFHPAH